jgi:hypothetical protein
MNYQPGFVPYIDLKIGTEFWEVNVKDTDTLNDVDVLCGNGL